MIPLLFMALGERDVSKVQLGELTSYTYVGITVLRRNSSPVT